MLQPYPRHKVLWYSENVSEGIDLEFVKGFVDGCLEQRFELVHAVLDLVCGFGVFVFAAILAVGET